MNGTSAQDAEQLKILSILYYIWGGLSVLFSCVGGVYILGVLGYFAASANRSGAPPAWAGALVAILGFFGLLLGIVMGGLSILAGKSIAERKRYMLCMVTAGLSCLSVPLGTALGVFTFIVLARPSVKAQFEQPSLPTT
jgi:hypothetical protein